MPITSLVEMLLSRIGAAETPDQELAIALAIAEVKRVQFAALDAIGALLAAGLEVPEWLEVS